MSTTHHHHSPGHSQSRAHHTGNIATALFLNTGFAIIKLIGRISTNSLAKG